MILLCPHHSHSTGVIGTYHPVQPFLTWILRIRVQVLILAQQELLPSDPSLLLVSEVSYHTQAEIHVLKLQKKSCGFYFSLAKLVSHEAGTQKTFMLQNSMCSLGPSDEQNHVQELTPEGWR